MKDMLELNVSNNEESKSLIMSFNVIAVVLLVFTSLSFLGLLALVDMLLTIK